MTGTTGKARMTSTTMGLPGVRFAPGLHICAFYRGAGQRDEILLPYLREGLSAGDACICVTDAADADASVRALAHEFGNGVGESLLRPLRSEATYLVDGYFATDRMLGFWDVAIGDAVARGAQFVRAVGEMTWALRDRPGVEDLVTYEARLNLVLLRYPQVLLCLYDLEQFSDGRILLEILRTHPTVLISGQMLDNPWYVEPEEYLAEHAVAAGG